jgi:hypothetical protein
VKVLQVIDQAFRTTTEEQDDAIIWLTRSMRGAGADLMVLLGGHAAQYATLTRRQPALHLGGWRQTEPADLPGDLVGLLRSGVPVYVIAEDLAERGLDGSALIEGVVSISRDGVPSLYEQANQVWQW